jgi:hypothetical protein
MRRDESEDDVKALVPLRTFKSRQDLAQLVAEKNNVEYLWCIVYITMFDKQERKETVPKKLIKDLLSEHRHAHRHYETGFELAPACRIKIVLKEKKMKVAHTNKIVS